MFCKLCERVKGTNRSLCASFTDPRTNKLVAAIKQYRHRLASKDLHQIEQELKEAEIDNESLVQIDARNELFIPYCNSVFETCDEISISAALNPNQNSSSAFEKLPDNVKRSIVDFCDDMVVGAKDSIKLWGEDPEEYKFLNFSIIYGTGRAQIKHMDIEKDTYQFAAVLGKGTPTEIYQGPSLDPTEVATKILKVPEIAEHYIIQNFGDLSMSKERLEEDSKPLLEYFVTGCLLALIGGWIHGAPDTHGKWRAVLFFTACKKTYLTIYDKNVQHTPFTFLERLYSWLSSSSSKEHKKIAMKIFKRILESAYNWREFNPESRWIEGSPQNTAIKKYCQEYDTCVTDEEKKKLVKEIKKMFDDSL